jgi:hypothetical protein
LIDPSRRKKKIEKGRKNKGEKRNTNIDKKIGNAKHERERIHNLS